MSNGVSNQATKHGRNTVGAVVDLEAERLLLGCIPHGHDQHESRVDGSFDETEHEAVRGDTSEVRACRGSHQDNSPRDASKTEELAHGQSLHSQSSRKLGD